jgi:TPR repeat protein
MLMSLLAIAVAAPCGTAESCFEEAFLAHARGNLSRAVPSYERACERDSAEACRALARLEPDNQARWTRAGGLFEAGCSAGEGASCIELLALVDQGRWDGVAADLENEGIRLLIEACDGGDVDACHGASQALGRSRRRPNKAAAATLREHGLRLEEAACQEGDLALCIELGTRFREGERAPQDLARAAAAFRVACDEGMVARACGLLAPFYRDGIGVAPDMEKSGALYRQSCDAGSSLSCSFLEVLCRQRELAACPDQ